MHRIIITESQLKKVLQESIASLSNIDAVHIILSSIPGLKNFDPTEENIQLVNDAKNTNTGYWLFAEWFMKQNNPMESALSLNYIGSKTALASYEFRDEGGFNMLWIMDVQSLQKGGFKELISYLSDLCRSCGIKYLGLQAYTPEVKEMYINKFGFKEINSYMMVKNIDID